MSFKCDLVGDDRGDDDDEGDGSGDSDEDDDGGGDWRFLSINSVGLELSQQHWK